MKLIIVCSMLFAAVIAEPPVENRYLPPQQNFAPSQSYGAPSGGFDQRHTDAVFRSTPSSTYGAPSRSARPSSQYGAPSRSLSNQYLPPQSRSNPSSRYLPPQSRSNQLSSPSSQYLPPQGRSGLSNPSAQYLPPQSRVSAQYLPPTSQYDAPAQAQGFGGDYQAPGIEYGVPAERTPSQNYGAPGFGVEQSSRFAPAPSSAYGAPEQSRQYLPPGAGRSGYDDGSNGEPANYNFEYMVKDEQSGNDFGHRESRQGDRAEGVYYVLLPDGRKQTVEYEADQDGFKPRISYEDTGLGRGYNRNAQDLSGYQSQGPY